MGMCIGLAQAGELFLGVRSRGGRVDLEKLKRAFQFSFGGEPLLGETGPGALL